MLKIQWGVKESERHRWIFTKDLLSFGNLLAVQSTACGFPQKMLYSGMGLDPNDDDYIAGPKCTLCEDVIFQGVTPKYILAVIENVIPCPLYAGVELNGTWLMHQIAHCWWATDPWPIIEVQFLINQSIFIATDESAPFFPCFNQSVAVGCQTTFVNQAAPCVPLSNLCTGGTAFIYWGPEVAP